MKIAARRTQVGIVFTLLGLIGGAAYYLLFQANPPSGSHNANPSQGQSVVSLVPKEHQVSVYWIEATEKKFRAVPQTVKAIDNEQALEQAIQQLFTAPPSGLYSGIPPATKLLNFSANDRDVFINVSKEFKEGGGSASMLARVTQVVYTASSLNPTANVFILVEGEPIGTVGGEGLEIKQPMTRQDLPLEF
ncbi:MAG: GerMN domain-containing protein [Pseudanabaenaceae cyanobacterium SKYGB_i_bin29]|nr:GerMN domain-containing protein [Pseudanabaenaceae cyanobacterium SKYG29]MDW8421881.1 GerMN domain-containing protein [Pseudanabaenaceae cyanobacterium SKYGB_i_bin29]